MDRLNGGVSTATLDRLSLDEKLELLAGLDTWHTRAVPRLEIPSLRLSDGPNGVRGIDDNHGPTSTSFPVGVAMGATWDPVLIEELGSALGAEAAARGVDVLLGPTVNLPRTPIGGRNFEAFSEDPLLSGVLAAGYVRGVQSQRVAACIKHFICNDQEHDRYNVDVRVDERALREIYVEPFRIAIDDAQPWAVMSSYNAVNGITASEHPLLEEVLRAELGFDGLVVSDWYGTYGPGVIASGLDLEMPGPGRWLSPDAVREALADGRVTEDDIDRKVARLLKLVERVGPRVGSAYSHEEHRALSRRVAVESMVLLKNDGLLPLRRPARIALIGELAAATPFQGGGSSSVHPHRVVSVLKGIEEWAGPGIEVAWSPGCTVAPHAPLLPQETLVGSGFTVDYFRTPQPEGEPVRSAHAARSFLSLFGEGDQWVDHQSFSLRMSTRFRARVAGVHEFEFRGAGRVRASIDGAGILDAWEGIPEDGRRHSIELAAGDEADIVVEYASIPGVFWRWLAIGCIEPGPEVSVDAAVRLAKEADVAIVVAGLTPDWESEGFDRPSMRLPGNQDELITAVAAAQPNTVVVVTAGSAVEMPWADDVGAVLQAWYGGQEVGHAVADVVSGRSDPGGRLPVAFPVDAVSHPGLDGYPGADGRLEYRDGIHVGYRGFDRVEYDPRFEFGHGLSFADFELGSVTATAGPTGISLRVELSNVGDRAGIDVIGVYAHDIGGVGRRLVGFEKVRLAAGDSSAATIEIGVDRLRWWDAEHSRWSDPPPSVRLSVCSNGGTWTGSIDLV